MGFEVGEVDGFFGDARGCAGFEAAEFEAEVEEGFGEAAGGLFVDAAALGFFFAGVHECAEEGAGGDDDAFCRKCLATFQDEAGDFRFLIFDFRLGVGEEAVDDAGDDGEVGAVVVEELLDFGGVFVFVGLCAGGLDGGAFRAVEHSELDAGGVDGVGHEAAEGVDFADDLSLGEAADGGVAGHSADGEGVHGDEGDAALIFEDMAGGPGGFGAGVSAADDDDVEVGGGGCGVVGHRSDIVAKWGGVVGAFGLCWWQWGASMGILG